MHIVVLPTVEYELYHGRNFVDEEATLFAPTERLLNRAERANIPFTLFPDVCSAWAYRKQGMDAFAARFEQQVLDAVTRGHDAQLHVHAHWLYSHFVQGEWQLREPKITLPDVDFETPLPASVIRQGVEYLETLVRTRVPEYRCTVFRAGGLLLDPQEPLMKALSESGIRIDTSIANDYRMSHDAMRVDYRGMPSQPNWNAGHGILEVPIGSFRMNLAQRLEFLMRRMSAVRRRRGSPISRSARQTRMANVTTLVQQNARYLASDPVFLFSADTKGFTKRMLLAGFHDYVRRHAAVSDAPIYVSMINHPKLMFAKEEDLLFGVLEELRAAYGGCLKFQTFRSLVRDLDTAAVPTYSA